MNINFDNMLGKPLLHCFVPADQLSITFVFEDGMRRSFGVEDASGARVGPCSVSSPQPTEGVVFTEVIYPVDQKNAARFLTLTGGVIFAFPENGSLTELPE